MGNITMGQYYHADSPMHRMDPRFKIMLTMGYLVLVFLVGNWWGYLALTAYLLLAIGCSGIPARQILRSLRPMRFILIFTFVLNVFFIRTGEPIFELGFIKITDAGLHKAVYMALRLMFLVAGTSLLTLTTSPILLTDGLERLLSPFKKIGFPAHEMAMMMTIALRFIPILIDETQKIRSAQMARGADFESGNIIQRAKAMIPLLVPLFVSAFRRADELAMAMEARCYHGGEGRTRMRVLKAERRDYLALLSMIIAAAVILLLRRF
jgi:energy-coupling factor transport system permease protein